MNETIIRVLMIDDDEDDALLVRRLLGGPHGGQYRVDLATSYAEGLERLCAGGHDIGLLDYSLGARNGLDLLREAQACQCRVPVIILTGLGVGLVEGLTRFVYPQASAVVVFVLMAIVLLVRPAGLFGRAHCATARCASSRGPRCSGSGSPRPSSCTPSSR
jgi:hypothetical protein